MPTKKTAKKKAPAKRKAKPKAATKTAAKPKAKKKPAQKKAKTAGPKPGTVIEREYKGKTYKVQATKDGFTFRGKEYRSLTRIAKAITGYDSISGPRFFGLVRPAGKEE